MIANGQVMRSPARRGVRKSGGFLAAATLGLCALAPFLAWSAPVASRAVPAASDQDLMFFEARVRPLLAQRCYACHSGKVSQGGLRLDTAEGLRRGGDSGPLVALGKPDESRLVKAVRYADPHLRMPPAGKMSDREIETLVTWAQRGAKSPSPPSAGAVKASGAMSIEEGKRFWSIRPLAKSEPPTVKRNDWPSRRIDAYLLARMERTGLAPSPRADRRTLIRRVSFALTGLPPAPEEVEAFVSDADPKAYEKLVERLLASPHYGERWARHWLDLVRYCDVPESWAQTEAQPWLYRDWVVNALNQDLPYSRFVTLQLAADEVPDSTPEDVAALGFLGLSPSYWKELKLAPDVIKTVVAEEWEERIHTVSSALLGLTVACARCHDHKFDPVTAQDYYALAGVFASTRLAPRPLLPAEEGARVMAAREKVKALEAEAKRLKEMSAKETAHSADLKRKAEEAQAQAAALKRETPHFDAPTAYAVDTAALQVLPDGPDRTRLAWQPGAGQDISLQVRGNPAKEGPPAPRRYLSVLSTEEPARFTHGSGRLDLAEAIFRDSAPLAARVIVNRVWKHHFGRGLVDTPSNFGVQGDRPTHPELLDDLAARFIANGWSLKWLHREILLSSAYQQASDATAVSNPASRIQNPKSTDADNRLLSRMNRRRLEVEPWRDAILAASGVLDSKLGGAPQELSDAKNVRRTLYAVVKRRELDDLLRLYDFPDPTTHSAARFHTTTPLQSLFVLNSEFFTRQAAALRERLRKDAPGDPDAQVRRAYALLYGRAPSDKELEAARRFLGSGERSDERWAEYLEVLLARNELMFVE